MRRQRREEHGGVVMVGRRNDHGVQARVGKQIVVIHVRFGAGRILLCRLQIGFIHFGNGDALRAELAEIDVEVAASPARADQAIGKAVVSAPRAARDEQRRGRQSRCQEGPAIGMCRA